MDGSHMREVHQHPPFGSSNFHYQWISLTGLLNDSVYKVKPIDGAAQSCSRHCDSKDQIHDKVLDSLSSYQIKLEICKNVIFYLLTLFISNHAAICETYDFHLQLIFYMSRTPYCIFHVLSVHCIVKESMVENSTNCQLLLDASLWKLLHNGSTKNVSPSLSTTQPTRPSSFNLFSCIQFQNSWQYAILNQLSWILFLQTFGKINLVEQFHSGRFWTCSGQFEACWK